MAMSFLSNMGQSGALLNFMRASVQCRTHLSLAEKLLETFNDLGEPSPLEQSILEKSAAMGRLFQFKRHFVVNYDHVTLIVTNLPEEEEASGRLRDNVTILAEATEGLSEIVDTRRESGRRAEHLQLALSGAEAAIRTMRGNYATILNDTRILFQHLVDHVERSFAYLETNAAHEAAISETMDRSVQQILALLREAGDFDRQFDEVVNALQSTGSQDLELF